MKIGAICTKEVDTATDSETVRTAAQRMAARNVGTLVVVDAKKTVIGIVTDRDLALRVVAQGSDPNAVRVLDAMTTDVQTVFDHASIEDALSLMRAKGVRRLPVVLSDGRVAGIISLDDILSFIADEFAEVRRFLDKTSPRSLARS